MLSTDILVKLLKYYYLLAFTTVSAIIHIYAFYLEKKTLLNNSHWIAVQNTGCLNAKTNNYLH